MYKLSYHYIFAVVVDDDCDCPYFFCFIINCLKSWFLLLFP